MSIITEKLSKKDIKMWAQEGSWMDKNVWIWRDGAT